MAIVAALGAAAPPSRATFPGQNGALVFGFGGTVVTENVDGTGRKTIVLLKPGVAVAAGEPAWSPNGARIAYSSRITGGGIQIVNADGTGLAKATTEPTDGEPTWSPDGTKLAYVHVSTGRRRLVTSNLDGSGLTVVTPTLERDVDDPEWSPDGTRLTFSDSTDIYVVNVDGSGLVDLTADRAEPGQADHPSWSPDGSKIAYRYLNSIKTIAPDGSGQATVVGNLGQVWELSWSPDGTKIAFANDVGGPLQEELFLVNADGTSLVRTGIDIETTLDWGVAAAAPPPPAVPPPVTGVNVNAKPVAGTVLVRLKGTTSFAALTTLSSIPVGSELDLTRGRVQLMSTGAGGTNQTAVFYQGRAVIGQTRANPPVTTLTLSGKLTCPKRKVSAKGAKTRSLWGNGKGNFQTFGRYASATVRGTYWLTQDTCTGTLIRVRSGTVTVLDKVRHRTITVGTGKSYVARARR